MAEQKPDRAGRLALVVADIFEAAGKLRRGGEAVARAHGQTQARWQLLSVISQGAWTVPRIAERLGITRQGVQRVADELQADGLARYDENPGHARSPFVVPTRAGTRALHGITEAAHDFNDRLAQEIGERDLATLHGALQRLLAKLRES